MSSPEKKTRPTPSGERTEPSGVRAVPRAADELEHEWESLSLRFVDEPVQAVEAADKVVRKQIHGLINQLSSLQSRLMRRWAALDETSTEELRACFQEYRELSRQVARMEIRDESGGKSR